MPAVVAVEDSGGSAGDNAIGFELTAATYLNDVSARGMFNEMFDLQSTTTLR